MGAIDALRDITRDRYDTEMTLIRCKTINEIADEIEEEINELRCKVEHVDWRLVASEILYKPADENIQSITEWLDKWYIPKPLDADGEPIRFGDLFEYKGEGKPEKLPVTGFEFYEDGSIYLYFKTAPNCAWTPRVEDARRANTDSIEKLRGEMINLTYASAEEAESLVDEWLARAERLFGGDAE